MFYFERPALEGAAIYDSHFHEAGNGVHSQEENYVLPHEL